MNALEKHSNERFKGLIYKKVTKDIDDRVDKLICGLSGEVIADESVVVYKMNRRKDPVTVTPWIHWTAGKVVEQSGEEIKISYILAENKSVGVLVNNDADKIIIPLRFS